MTYADLSMLRALPDYFPGQDPRETHKDHIRIIKDAITTDPRSLQKTIGPSEIGHPCTRRIGYTVAGTEKVNDEAAWRPTVGRAVHLWLADVFMAANTDDNVRYLVETSAEAGESVTGTLDLYDRAAFLVNDWKIVAPSMLRKYRANGPGEQYRVQIHGYARGLIARGLRVDTVGITFLPMNGELHEAVFWSEPYDEGVTVRALLRLAAIRSIVSVGGKVTPSHLPTDGADPDWCRYCPFYLPASTDLTEACPGAVKKRAPATVGA